MRLADSDSRVVPEHVAERVLARAAELDVAQGGAVPVASLRAAAAEAGIAPPKFEAALAEVSGPAGLPAAPWWVRACLFGVVDRRVAMAFYWLFGILFLAGAWLTLALPARVSSAARLALLGTLAGWAAFSMWSTARAVRWLDRHGWDRLP